MVNELDATLAALAEPTRRRVVELLRTGPRRPGELAASLGTSAPALSRHLRVLRTTGLVTEERVDHDARVHVYRLRPEPFAGLDAWLQDVRSFWAGQLDAYRVHVERTRGGHRT